MDLKKLSIPEKFKLITQLQARLNEGQFIVSYLKVKKKYQIGFVNGAGRNGYGFKVISGDITECIDKAILFLIKAYKKHYNEEFEATYNFSKILKEKDGEIEFLKNKIKDLESGKKKRGRPKGTRIIKGFLEPKNTDFFEGDIKSLIDYLSSQGLIQGKEDIIKGSIGKGEQTSKFSEAAIEREILRGNPDISGVPHLFFIYNNDKQEFIKLRAKAYRRLWNKHNKNNNGNK